jgi:hypothetical protein
MAGIENFCLQQGKVALKGKLDTKEETLDNVYSGAFNTPEYMLSSCVSTTPMNPARRLSRLWVAMTRLSYINV